jgi:hypothetical protein
LKEDEGIEDVRIEEKQWEEIAPKPFESTKVSYVAEVGTENS